jgi:hypothetical protein
MPCPAHAVALKSRFENGMVVAWYGRGMTCDANTAALCKSNGKDTIYTPGGMGAAWYVLISL